MKIGLIAFDGITFLDLIGFYDVIYRLNLFEEGKGTTWDFCGMTEEITDELGLTIKVNKIKPDLSNYDLIFVPGGWGQESLDSMMNLLLGLNKLRMSNTLYPFVRGLYY
nr:hypothetical protein [Cohnella herbarum]